MLNCADKSRLFAAYNRDVIEWSKAVRSLSDHAGSAEFALRLLKVDEARAKTQQAKAAYDAHLSEHAC
jgi:hypothetical protein